MRLTHRHLVRCTPFLAGIGLAITVCSIQACSRGPLIVVYDEEGSRKAGIAAFPCAMEIRDSCQRQVIEGEANFLNDFSRAFMATPECRDVKLQVDSGEKQLIRPEYLTPTNKQEIWKLLIEYRPTILG